MSNNQNNNVMQWTDKQLDVINTRKRNILVSAAAGSGKTAVLVERIIQMITDKDDPTDIDQLLVVTFTKAAASEMKERIIEALENLVENNPEDINAQKQLSYIHNAHISTIDSFCASVVKDNFHKIDLDPNFRIADDAEIELLKSDIMDEMLEEYYEKAEPEFINLAEQYSTGKLSDNLGDLINTLYRYSTGHINAKRWIESCADIYRVESIEEFEKSDTIKILFSVMRSKLGGWIKSLDTAINIANSPEGPGNADKLLEMVELLETAKSNSTYEGLRRDILNIKTITYRAVKDCNEIQKSQVASIKKDVADGIKELQNGIFAQSIEQIYDEVKSSRESVEMIVKLTTDFVERFSKEKREKGIMDFGDQAHYALNILNNEDEDGNLVPSETARQMAAQFKEILIDEYQDSNMVQEAILTSVSRGKGINNMFMVGDVKQSIYRFRLAEPRLFLKKYDNYSDDLTANYCKIILDKNFRSRQEVVDSVNYIFDFIMNRQVGGIDYKDGNRLSFGASYEDSPKGQDNRTEFIIIDGEERKDEAQYVAQKIREITDPVTGMKITEKGKGMRPVRLGDIAILLRSMKGVSDIYQEQLENNGIPCFADSKTGYYKALEVKTIINMLTVIDNPRQDIPLAAVMTSPMFKFSSNDLAKIKTANVGSCLYDCVKIYDANGKDDGLKIKVTEFLNLLNRFRCMVPYTSVYEIIDVILEETGYGYYVRAMANGKKRYLNIESLKEKAVAYDSTSYKGLFNFIRYIEKIRYLSKDDGEASVVSENDDIVRIMSIHKSKGLQFPVVFVCDTNGRKKTDSNKIVIDDSGYIGVDCIDSRLKVKFPTIIKQVIKMENREADMAEMLRILYVALTRAKEKLFITGVDSKAEELARQFANCRYNTSELMSYNDIVEGKNLMEWMGRAIGRNKTFDCVTGEHEYNASYRNSSYDTDCNIKVSVIPNEDIIFNEIKHDITDEIKKETLYLLENNQNIDSELQEKLNRNFDYVYPFIDDVTLHCKASVTEIKKQSMSYEEEIDGAMLYNDSTFVELPEIVPDFMKVSSDDKDFMTGAQRGTAYHRVFELLDMDIEEYSEESVKEMLSDFVKTGMIDHESAKSVNPTDIVKFTKTKLFGRMQEAHKKNKLFREQKFLMCMPAKDIKGNSSKSDQTMIIHGIIDACFIENDKYVIMDYKTDRVSNAEELIDRYKIQLECYKDAIEQIAKTDVTDMIIYSVHLGQEITI